MIISASFRTDIPAYFGDWFAARRRAGFVDVRNPYNGRMARVDLSPEAVDGYVFWTRNPVPFWANLESLADDRVPFVIQFTLTGYQSIIEPSGLPVARAIAVMQRLRDLYGPDALVWRYDPIDSRSM